MVEPSEGDVVRDEAGWRRVLRSKESVAVIAFFVGLGLFAIGMMTYGEWKSLTSSKDEGWKGRYRL